jgi:hypothetical protein
MHVLLWWKQRVHPRVYANINQIDYKVPEEGTESGWSAPRRAKLEFTPKPNATCVAVAIPDSSENLMLGVDLPSFELIDYTVDNWKSHTKPENPLKFELSAKLKLISVLQPDGMLRVVASIDPSDFDRAAQGYTAAAHELKGKLGYEGAFDYVTNQAGLRPGFLASNVLRSVTAPSCGTGCLASFKQQIDPGLYAVLEANKNDLVQEDLRQKIAAKVPGDIARCVARDPSIKINLTADGVVDWTAFKKAAQKSEICEGKNDEKGKAVKQIEAAVKTFEKSGG